MCSSSSSSSSTMLLHTSALLTPPLKHSLFSHHYQRKTSINGFPQLTCRSSLHNSPITEFNLYELLGIDASSDKSQIKEAYRSLQKRCHPDIAGPQGHDMAIVLNEAYALLSDPVSRMAYDKELAKVADLQGYTGKPIYSAWFGSESEDRAVFVDEVKCVGCLKCALFADKTFAIESIYGRARVVAQWADPEHKIREAIGSCPVDCISIVERSNLAALEFIMSKQPRSRVRVGASNTSGERTSDVFDEAEKFQTRYAQHTASKNYSRDFEEHGYTRISAIQAIQMISNWLYWQSPSTEFSSPTNTMNLRPRTRKSSGPNVKKLKAAAEARKQPKATTAKSQESSSEYWVPSASFVLPEATSSDPSPKAVSNPVATKNKTQQARSGFTSRNEKSRNPLSWILPMGTAMAASAVVWLQLKERPDGGLQDHVGGSFALAIVNSSWLQVMCAGITWYLISMYVVELVEALRRK